MQYLSKQINFNNLYYRYKGNTAVKSYVGFNGPIDFYRIIKEKSEEEQFK